MPDSLYFVHFPHPGGEPPSVKGDWLHWNQKKHVRKCLQSPGRWRRSASLTAREYEGELVFWGEWEPPSRVRCTDNPKHGGWPRAIHTPFWHSAPGTGHFHNTDPYVFGSHFRYSNCRQNTEYGPCVTQCLLPGSVVAFGSRVAKRFVIDTVFVVASAQSVTQETIDELVGADTVFKAAVLDLFYGEGKPPNRYRLYRGATPANPVSGMFSFFPALPVSKAPDGFPRPSVRLGGYISPDSWQNFKATQVTGIEESAQLWRRLAEQTLAQGLHLGVKAATPRKVPKSYSALNGAGGGDKC